MVDVITGGCLCGQARYTVRRTMRFQPYACHCTDCQTRSGSAFGLQLVVATADLEVEGNTIEGRHERAKGTIAKIFACSDCLTRLYTANDRRPDTVNLRAGTLDDSASLIPGFPIWISSKQPWVMIPKDVPTFKTQPADPADWQMLLNSVAV